MLSSFSFSKRILGSRVETAKASHSLSEATEICMMLLILVNNRIRDAIRKGIDDLNYAETVLALATLGRQIFQFDLAIKDFVSVIIRL